MGGLYNTLLGRNPHSPVLLGVIGITMQTKEKYPLGRIRDVYTNEAGDRVFIFTRNYGEDGKPYDEALAKNPNYVGKTYDSFDSTYSTYEFTVPEEFRILVKEVADISDNVPPMVKFRKLLDDLQNGRLPDESPALQVGKQICDALKDVMEGRSSSKEVGDVIIGRIDGNNEHES